MAKKQFETFTVYHDQKVTVWTRTKFSITAESKKEAASKVIHIIKHGDCYNDYAASYRIIEKTEKPIPYDEAVGEVTEEIFLDDPTGVPVWDNSCRGDLIMKWSDDDDPTNTHFEKHPPTCNRSSATCETHHGLEGVMISVPGGMICPCGKYEVFNLNKF
jgi:hypothetical protein